MSDQKQEPQRILVTGSREWTDRFIISAALFDFPPGTKLCHGGAKGADAIAAVVATEYGFEVTEYPARWSEHGKRAGPIRNQNMLDDFKPTLVLAFPLPQSVGTYDMIRRAKKAGIEVREPA